MVVPLSLPLKLLKPSVAKLLFVLPGLLIMIQFEPFATLVAVLLLSKRAGVAELRTCKGLLGAAVPIPTFPLEKSYTNPDVSIASPPAMVEVAVVDVAKNVASVGVDVATSCPELSRDVSMSVPSQEKVTVPVAVIFAAAIIFPETSTSPRAERVADGEEVPMPTLPPLAI